MKMTKICSILTALMIFIFGVRSTVYGANLNVGEPRTVRMIYFHPKDRPFRPEVVNSMKSVIRYTQTFYVEQMQAHGYVDKTFHFETDARGKPKVHRVVGQYPSDHYGFFGEKGQVHPMEEFSQRSSKIDFIVFDLDDVAVRGYRQGKNNAEATYSSELILTASKTASRVLHTGVGEYEFDTVLHELGHAFGLPHDWRDDAYIMSYGDSAGKNRLSAYAAEFLAVHPYFNLDIPLKDGTPPTIELISSATYSKGSKSIPVRLKVKDPDGIHQIALHAGEGIHKYRSVNGKQEAIVEFEYDGAIALLDYNTNKFDFVNLSDAATHPIYVEAVDTDGNVGTQRFHLVEKSSHHIATLRAHTTNVPSLAFSPDGQTLASSSYDGVVKLWDVATRHNIATLVHSGQVFSVSFSPDGTLLASGGTGGSIKLWDLTTGRNTATFDNDYVEWVESVSFLPDGKTLASAGGGNQIPIKLWNLTTGRNITTLVFEHEPLHDYTERSVSFSPDGKTYASFFIRNANNVIKVWDLATGRNIATLGPPNYVASVSFSPDGMLLASGDQSGEVKVWDLTTGRNIATVDHTGTKGIVYSVSFSPDGMLLASGDDRGEVKLWDLATNSEIAAFPNPDPSARVTVSPDGLIFTVSVTDISFSPDGEILASGKSDGTIDLWDLSILPATTPREVEIADPTPEAVVEVPLYWIDTKRGTIHRLIETQVENLLPDVQNAASLVMDMAGDKLYWTEILGNNRGRIKRANLDGSNVKLVKELTSVPLDLDLDTAAGKLYLTNAWGKVQRLNVDGSNFQSNLITGLKSPKHLALDAAGGQIYWIQQTSDTTGKIRSANLDGSNLRLVKDLTSSPRGLALDAVNKKLYLTNTYGKVQRLNLNGSNFQPNLITDLDAPEGVSVDVAGGKIYWTERGRIRRANLDGSQIEDVIIGAIAPGQLALAIPEKMLQEPKVVHFPDQNLAKSVRTALKLGPNAPITDTALETLTHLEARNKKIKNLTGLEHAKALKTLDLDENEITNVWPLQGLKQLESLLIGGNKIGDTGVRHLSDLTRLKGLSLYRDQIGNITPLAKLTKLESLWLDDNEIRDISALSKLVNLRTLHLRDNKIRDVSPLAKLTKLESLRLAGNPIQDTAPLQQLLQQNPDMELDIEVVGVGAAPTAVAARPAETALLTNFPNPFNPETWIPYQLATDTDVKITIYNTQGVVVRTLALGHQSAGYYTAREHAAYWDGRNALGESVASGLYFYTFTAGEFTATRKMLIRK